VLLQQIPDDIRLEAEYFQPKFLEMENRLLQLKCETLESFSVSVNSGPFGSNLLKENYVEDGVVVLRPFNIREATIDKTNIVFITEEEISDAKLDVYEPGDLAFARVGAVGCGVIPDFNGRRITISPNIIVARIDKQKIDPRFLAVFMNTRWGQLQMQRAMKVVAQPTITVEAVKRLLIPHIADDERRKIVEDFEAAQYKKEDSKRIYAEAETLLLNELGLNDLDATHSITYERDFREVAAAGRFDAEYFHPKYYRLMAAVENSPYTHQPLGSIIEPIRNGFDFREFQETGNAYIRVGDVRNGKIDIDGAARIRISMDEIKKDVRLKIGDVLFTRKGSFGNAAVVRPIQETSVISSEIMLLRPLNDDIVSDYLALYLNSQAGFLQVERYAHGAAFYSISQYDLARLAIIIPPKPVQEGISKLLKESLQAGYDAQNLLETAKRRVEELIEGGG